MPAGVDDLICNWVGNKRWIDELPWAGAGDWSKATMQQWQGGEYKAVGPLSFVKVAGAGHMVRGSMVLCRLMVLCSSLSGALHACLRR